MIVSRCDYRYTSLIPTRRSERRRFRAMAFARSRLLLGLQPYMRTTNSSPYLRATLQTRRLLSSSSCSHAQHAPANHTGNTGEHSHRHDHTTPQVRNTEGTEVDPYKDGPSALDKAVHIFFFTEIVRGMVPVFLLRYEAEYFRHVGCTRELFPTSVHNHVPLREGTLVSPVPRRACSSSLP